MWIILNNICRLFMRELNVKIGIYFGFFFAIMPQMSLTINDILISDLVWLLLTLLVLLVGLINKVFTLLLLERVVATVWTRRVWQVQVATTALTSFWGQEARHTEQVRSAEDAAAQDTFQHVSEFLQASQPFYDKRFRHKPQKHSHTARTLPLFLLLLFYLFFYYF